MANDFKTGDVVILRSGGPLMTVQPEPAGDVDFHHTVWFAHDGEQHSGFHRDEVRKATWLERFFPTR